MTEQIAALSLTGAELAAILTYWHGADEFEAWQRDVLAGEIEARAAAKAATDASAAVREAVEAAREQFPSVFDAPVTPEQ